uniref:Beta-synuclein n=1 Tax=Gopherus agassizii TaxID=38772 RepID=A0A452HPP5_9SAUR
AQAQEPGPPSASPSQALPGSRGAPQLGTVTRLRLPFSVAEKTKEQASQLGEAVISGAGNIAAATGLVKKEESPTDLKPEEVGQEAVEEPLIEPLLEPESENYEEPPQDYQEFEPEA